jgi:hypothetical protein
MNRKLIYFMSFIFLLGLAGSANGVEGLLGEYYERDTANPWQNLLMKRLDPTVNFNWGSASPDPSVPADNFMIRWTGEVEAPASATYTFYTQTDDGVRLWVDNVTLIDNWTDHGNTQDQGNIKLTAGQRYEIRLEFYENGGDAVCQLYWSTPTMAREIIKSQYLWVGGSRPNSRFPDPLDGALIRNTWISLEWSPGDYAASHSIYIGENRDEVEAGTDNTFRINQTDTSYSVGFSGFPYPDGLVPGTTYYWRIEEVNDSHPDSPWKGDVWSFTITPRTAFKPDPDDGGEGVKTNGRLTWQPGFDAKLHFVYFGDDYDTVNNAVVAPPTGLTSFNPGTMEPAKVYFWRVDEFDGVTTHKGDVWSFTTTGAVGTPNPPYGAINVSQTQKLSWAAGDYAVSHRVYFGTDKDAVRNATTSSPEYKGPKNLGSESYDPGLLEWDTEYYWRIDEINDANSNSPWKGNVWSFTTANFFVVDDIESYNDIDPPNPLSNTIFAGWPDGYGTTDNGALVGYDPPPPYAERNIVHSGHQSMPYSYDADLKYAEATHKITYPRDWTQNNAETLSLWFKGDYINVAVPMYVAIANTNGTRAVVNHDNPQATRLDVWTEWTIPLQAFADQGVDLTDVDTISIGFGNKTSPQAGGSGSMFFDDIRLYTAPDEEQEQQQ